MLPREVMGILCLGVVWMTALLVAGAAWQDLRDLRAIVRRAKNAIRGTVEAGDLAEWAVEQTGRATDDDAIAFHDREFHSEILGGKVKTDSSVVDIAPSRGEVWIDERVREEAASAGDLSVYEAAFPLAKKAKGFARTVRVRIRTGDSVWIVGKAEAPEIVSTIDPAAWCSRKSLVIALFIPIELAVAGAATRLALSTPHFGTMSILGAVACMAFFLGVTPIAVALRESIRRPHEAFLRTEWSKKALSVAAEAAIPQKN